MHPKPGDPSGETGLPGRFRQQWADSHTGFRYRKKKWMQLYLWAAVAALLLVVAALPQMVFQPGQPLPTTNSPLMPFRFIWLATILLIFGFFILIPRSFYSRLLPGLLLLILLVPTLLWGLEQFLIYAEASERLAALRGEGRSLPTPVAEEPEESVAATELIDPNFEMLPPLTLPRLSWLNYLLAVAILLLGLLGVMSGVAWFWQRSFPEEDEVLPDLAREAEAALESLRQGGGLADVVIRCYMEMGRVLYETRGMARPQYATPHEFAHQLLKLGLPAGPVDVLTGLFEQVRYGQTHPNPEQQTAAIASLEAIVQACQRE